MPTPCLIPVPGGLAVSGVARFAVRLAGALAEQGRPAALLLHAPSPGASPLAIDLDPRIRVFDAWALPPIEAPGGPEAAMAVYREAIESLADSGPVAVLLGQHAGPFEIVADLLDSTAEAVRPVGISHSDNTYDTRVLAHFEPMLCRLVGVSEHLASRLRETLPGRAGDVARIAYGIEIPASLPPREPAGGRPLKLLYAGRLEHRQKRITALPMLSAELTARGIDHTLTIVGEGPARADLEALAHDHAAVRIGPPATPAGLAGLIESHDAFVLPSRFEGLSIAMLEALARGCVPVVAPSRSGTQEVVRPGITGEIARCTPDDDEPAVALALADAIDALRRRDLAELATRCRDHAEAHFSLASHAAAWAGLIDRVAAEPPRPWPADRPIAFDAPSASGHGSVPADAPVRLERALRSIGNEPFALHGAGAHTAALAAALTGTNLVCTTDDDRQRHGETMLGVPVVAPERASEHGARHVIISTHLHEADVWRRRAVYERQGLVVHRLYEEEAEP